MPNYAKRIRDDTVGILLMERKIADLAMAAYRKWIPLVADQVLPSLTADGSLDPDGLMPDIDALMLTQEQWDAILDGEFIPGVQELMALQIEERLEEDDVEIPEEIKVPPVAVAPAIPMGKAATRIYAVPALRDLQASYLENVRNRMVRTPDTVFREIAKDINLGMADGEGIKDLRKRVQVFLDGNLDDWKGRAETVARTEATGAYNGASHAASEFRAELHGVELEKVWVATMDSRTRKTHFAADGQRRRMNERFKVGRANLRYPGDPAGPAGEIINCRCSMLELEPDDELPGETDRQTERSTTDATVRNRVGGRVGDIKGEVDRRSKEEGITRARDDEDGEGIVASANTEEKHMARPTWTGVLAPLGTPTGDGRIIKEGAAITFRDFPLPLSWQKTSADGHLQSVVIGGIVAARVDGSEITAEGFLLETPEANEAKDLLAEKLIRPSIDPADVVWEMVDEAGNPVDYEQMEAAWMAGEDFVVLDQFAEMKVMGATLVDHPAFAEAQITLDAEPQEEIAPADSEEGDDAIDVAEAEASLVASVAAIAERRITDDFYVEKPDVFEDPGFTEVTRLHMTDDGRVQGHVAAWGTCHVGYTNECKTPPHSMTNYGYFHQSEIGVPGGRLGVGRLTVGGGHADSRLGMQAALSHYDNTGASWAFVRAGEDEHGIWVSGVPHPAATTLQIAEGLSAPLSGDWRRRGGNLEMIAALAVVSGGFPQPRGYRDDAGREGSLVAAGALQPSAKAGKPNGKSIEQIVAAAATRAVENYAARQQREARVAAVHLRITERKRAFVAEVATKIAAG